MYSISEHCLGASVFHQVQAETRSVLSQRRRSGVLWLRSGSAVPYTVLAQGAPTIVGLYENPGFVQMISAQFGQLLQVLPEHMPHRCSLLVSDREGDHIAAHYDTNFYKGSTVTVLLTIFNRAANGRCCSSNKTCVYKDGREACRDTAENSLLIMEGDRLKHFTRKQGADELRVVLSLVYTTDPTQSLWQQARMRLKDWSFFK